MHARAALNDRIDEEEASEEKKNTRKEREKPTANMEEGKEEGREARRFKRRVRIGGGGWVGEGGTDRDQRQLPSVGCLRADFN